MVKGKTANVWVKAWSTVIGANTAYLSVTPSTSSIASSVWDAYSGGATITGLKCGDFQMKAEIRSGSSRTATHTGAYNYTVIPDIVGDTAFVQNVATGKYIDLEQVNYVPTDIVQQWSFHGGTQSQWIFELGGSGYFKIKSVKTGKYIGVDSSDTSKVKQYSTVTDYTLWKIGETSSRNYKFACKALESSGKVLCAPTITSGDGADLTMLVYGDNSSYGDEWTIQLSTRMSNLTMTRDESRTADLNSVSYLSPCTATSFTYEVIYHPTNVSVNNTNGKITALKTGSAYIKAVHKASKEAFVFKVTVRKDAIIIVPGIFGSELFIDGDQGNFKDGDHLITTEIVDTFENHDVADVFSQSLLNKYIQGSAHNNLLVYGNALYNALSCDDDGNSIYDVYTKKYNPNLAVSDGHEYTANCGTLDYYGDLYDAFNNNAQITDKYVVDFFSYDWRLSNGVSAQKLDDYIEEEGYGKVILVAHSMGGQVASGYLALGETQRNKVDGVYMLASPLLGTPEVVNVWANLDFTFLVNYEHNSLVAEVFNFLLSCVALEPNAARALIGNYRSVYELLPTERYPHASKPYLKHTVWNFIVPSQNDESYCYGYGEARDLLEGKLMFFNSDLMDYAENFHDGCYLGNTHVSSLDNVNTKYICATSYSDSSRSTLTQLNMYEITSMEGGSVSYNYGFDASINENVGDTIVPHWSATAGLSVTDDRVRTYSGGHKYPVNHEANYIINDILS